MKKTILALSVSLAVSTSISAAVTENNIVYPLHIYEQLTIGEAVGGNYYYT